MTRARHLFLSLTSSLLLSAPHYNPPPDVVSPQCLRIPVSFSLPPSVPASSPSSVSLSLSVSQVGRVAIHNGDKGADLAADFCRLSNLDDRTRDILGETLQKPAEN